jgi:hypothetical protein
VQQQADRRCSWLLPWWQQLCPQLAQLLSQLPLNCCPQLPCWQLSRLRFQLDTDPCWLLPWWQQLCQWPAAPLSDRCCLQLPCRQLALLSCDPHPGCSWLLPWWQQHRQQPGPPAVHCQQGCCWLLPCRQQLCLLRWRLHGTSCWSALPAAAPPMLLSWC